MIVLGLNGFTNEHDAAAALIINGKLRGFAEEERFTRIKRAINLYPHNAVKWLLHDNDITIDDIDVFALGWDIPKMIVLGFNYEFSDYLDDKKKIINIITGYTPNKAPEIVYVPHHIAHAASSFFSSGYHEAISIVLDGRGEESSISCYIARDNTLSELRHWNIAFSLGFLYEAASFYSGFSDWDAGKTMGLSSYAVNSCPLNDFMQWKDDEIILFNQFSDYNSVDLCERWLEMLYSKFGVPQFPTSKWNSILNSYDVTYDKSIISKIAGGAGAVQETVVDIISSIIRYCIRETGISNICLSGGVALNCAANGRIANLCSNLFIFPAANDAGTAFGAAAWIASQNDEIDLILESALVGPEFNKNEIQGILNKCNIKYTLSSNPIKSVSEYLLDGKTVGWFQGRMEMGPRALGARSILAYPNGNPGRDVVNSIKSREKWRPFAPSLLAEEQTALFYDDFISRYMLLGVKVKPRTVSLFPDIVHVDCTSRPHTVLPQDGEYYDLLSQLKHDSGTGIVLNTSFNGRNEPIVCTPYDAIRTFFSTGLDILYLDGYIITKNRI